MGIEGTVKLEISHSLVARLKVMARVLKTLKMLSMWVAARVLGDSIL